jgi:hypothetical protein
VYWLHDWEGLGGEQLWACSSAVQCSAYSKLVPMNGMLQSITGKPGCLVHIRLSHSALGTAACDPLLLCLLL